MFGAMINTSAIVYTLSVLYVNGYSPKYESTRTSLCLVYMIRGPRKNRQTPRGTAGRVGKSFKSERFNPQNKGLLGRFQVYVPVCIYQHPPMGGVKKKT